MPSATALTCFLCYTLVAGEKLTVSKAFTSLALFSALQGPMVSLPGQIFAITEGEATVLSICSTSPIAGASRLSSVRLDESHRKISAGERSPSLGLLFGQRYSTNFG